MWTTAKETSLCVLTMTRSKAKDKTRGHKVQRHENELGGCSVTKMARERAERGQRERCWDGSTIDEAQAQTGTAQATWSEYALCICWSYKATQKRKRLKETTSSPNHCRRERHSEVLQRC